MPRPTEPLIQVGQCLPRLSLPRTDGHGTVSLGDGTSASVVVLPHPGCPPCQEWLNTLGAVVGDLRLWGTRPVAVLPDGVDAAAVPAGLPYPVLSDPGGVARRRLGLGPGVAALIVADRWGGAYEVTVATEDHPVPHGAGIVRLAQFVDLQCAECGAPGAEWSECTPLPLG